MSIEEKAKAYDEAIERFKSFKEKYYTKDTSLGDIIFDKTGEMQKDFENIFHELRESEDERVRKILIHIVKGACGKYGIKYKGDEITEEKLIAYLEKQKEQHIPWYDYQKSKKAGYTIVPNEEYEQLIKQKEPNLTWNEKDKKVYSRLLNHYESLTHCVTTADRHQEIREELNFLKSLRPQPKQEWSKEDEEHLKSIISTLEMCMKDCEDAKAVLGYYESDISWLKSLRPVSKESLQSWKPSKQEIDAFETALKGEFQNGVYPAVRLCELFQKLKKLCYNDKISQWKPSEGQMHYLHKAVTEAKQKEAISTTGYTPARVLESLYEQLKAL